MTEIWFMMIFISVPHWTSKQVQQNILDKDTSEKVDTAS